MGHLTVRGAREHNLRAVDLDLPLGKLIVFTGVSGSGKSSLAFDTVHAEGRRRYLEALSIRMRQIAGGLRRPDVDVIQGLPPTIALEQRGGAPRRRATVGTWSEVQAVMRVVFARAGVQHCPSCDQPIRPQTHDEIVGALMSRAEGSRLILEAPLRLSADADRRGILREVARAGFSRMRVDGNLLRLEDVGPAMVAEASEIAIVVDRIRLRPDRRGRVHDAVRTTSRAGRGVVLARLDDTLLRFVDRPVCLDCDRHFPALRPELFSQFGSGGCTTCSGEGELPDGAGTCPDCQGQRLGEEARAVRVNGHTMPELGALPLDRLADTIQAWSSDPVIRSAIEEVGRRLQVLCEVGLGYLSLDRSCATLSTGEWQRLRLSRQVGSELSGIVVVLDEPTAGIGPDGVMRVIALLKRLRDQGNTVIVVEHTPEVIRVADYVVEFGPGPGARGGQVVFAGSVADLLAGHTTTAQWLNEETCLPDKRDVNSKKWVAVSGLTWGSLQAVDLRLPLGALTAITGTSGSGKSSLLGALEACIGATLRPSTRVLPTVSSLTGVADVERLIVVNHAGMGRTRTSNAATYTGLWNVVRDLLASTQEAQIRGLGVAFFSLNVKGGRCEACQGSGLRRVDLQILPDVFVPCGVCHGRRFNADVLEVTWKGRNAHELLELRVEEAHLLLAGHPQLEAILRSMMQVGLGYIPLGQPSYTLSGGEAQRLRLAKELARAQRRGGEGTLYLLDDPTTGLHPADIGLLASLLQDLVSSGSTVWIATHHPGLAAMATYQVHLGPGPGAEGGRVLWQERTKSL